MPIRESNSSQRGLIVKSTALDFSKLDGLVPFVLQDEFSKEILMVGFLNEEAWEICCSTGILTMYRRTLQRVWTMGEEDGNLIPITRVRIDCDQDTVIFETTTDLAICGHGSRSCFIQELPGLAQP
mgnify:FL=1|jgi:phosphoribosyl-ATP pyrophosphohydrolase/phosphoribosyl-AMP cyclohydrolase